MRKRPSLSFVDSILVGVIAGSLVIGLRFLFFYLSHLRTEMRNLNSILYSILWIVLIIGLSLLTSLLIKRNDATRQSGETQVHAQLLGLSKPLSIPLIFSKFVGTLASAFAGLSLGHGGPSMLIGAHAGKVIADGTKADSSKQKTLILSGQAAGFSAGFSTPIAATIFNLELINKTYTASIILPSLVASVVADLLCRFVFKLPPLINIKLSGNLPIQEYGWIILLAILLGILGVIFNKLLVLTSRLLHRLTIHPNNYVFGAYFITILLFIFYPIAQGVDISLLSNEFTTFSITALIVLLIIKLFFTLISYQSNAMGDLLLPLILLGGISAILFNKSVAHFDFIDTTFLNHYIVIGMGALLSGALQAPLFAIVFLAELTNSPHILLPLGVASLIAHFVAAQFEVAPLYSLLMVRQTGYKPSSSTKERVMLKVYLSLDSDLDQKRIMDLGLPAGTLIISIYRYGQEVNVDGQVKLHAGDLITLVVKEDQQRAITEMFH